MYYYTKEDEELIELSIDEPNRQEFIESLMFNGFDR